MAVILVASELNAPISNTIFTIGSASTIAPTEIGIIKITIVFILFTTDDINFSLLSRCV